MESIKSIQVKPFTINLLSGLIQEGYMINNHDDSINDQAIKRLEIGLPQNMLYAFETESGKIFIKSNNIIQPLINASNVSSEEISPLRRRFLLTSYYFNVCVIYVKDYDENAENIAEIIKIIS